MPHCADHRLLENEPYVQSRAELLGYWCAAAVHARPHRYKELAADIRVFPQAAALLRALHGDGLALATSAPTDELEMLRKALDADEVIDGQTTSDDVGKSKPSPEVFETAMKAFAIDPRHALASGTAFGTFGPLEGQVSDALSVESGGFSQHELSEAGSPHVYRDVAEILNQLYTGPSSSSRGWHSRHRQAHFMGLAVL